MPLLISSYSLKNESENMGQQESACIHVKIGLDIDPELSHQMGPGLDMAWLLVVVKISPLVSLCFCSLSEDILRKKPSFKC